MALKGKLFKDNSCKTTPENLYLTQADLTMNPLQLTEITLYMDSLDKTSSVKALYTFSIVL